LKGGASVIVLLFGSAASLGPCSKATSASGDGGQATIASSMPTAANPSTVPPIAATPAPSATTSALRAAAGLALGDYACTHDYWTGAMPNRQRRSDPTGAVKLLDGGTYRWLDDGATGRYTFDPATGNVAWVSGPIADKKPRRTTYRRNEHTSQIDITFSDGVDWSCGHNL